jgi:hypothetical protein
MWFCWWSNLDTDEVGGSLATILPSLVVLG